MPIPSVKSFFLLVAALGIAACAKPKPPEPTVVRVTIVAAPDVNPDIKGRASPIVVRAYELKSAGAFSSASFIELFEKDKDVLGADMLSREVVQLPPNGSKSFEKELKGDASHIGVFAAYRDWQHARWSASAEIPSNKTVNLVVRIDKLAVSMQMNEVSRPKK